MPGMLDYTHEPRWTYSAPTEKPQPGLPNRSPGYDIKKYGLPVIDVQTSRRNFPGYSEAQVYSLDELRKGDTSGSTETDSYTAANGSEGYTRINKKSGGTGRGWKSTSPRSRSNTEKIKVYP